MKLHVIALSIFLAAGIVQASENNRNQSEQISDSGENVGLTEGNVSQVSTPNVRPNQSVDAPQVERKTEDDLANHASLQRQRVAAASLAGRNLFGRTEVNNSLVIPHNNLNIIDKSANKKDQRP